MDEGHRVIDWFLSALPEAACLRAQDIVLVVDAARPELYDSGQLAAVQASYFIQMRNRLVAQGRARGFRVVGMEAVFIAAYASDRQRFEFPIDAHWNAHGHEVAAAAVAEALADWPALAAPKK